MTICLLIAASFAGMELFIIIMNDKIKERYAYNRHEFAAIRDKDHQIYIMKDCFRNMCLSHKILACVTGTIGLPFIFIKYLLNVVNYKWLIR